jgi:hypothetical protein
LKEHILYGLEFSNVPWGGDSLSIVHTCAMYFFL